MVSVIDLAIVGLNDYSLTWLFPLRGIALRNVMDHNPNVFAVLVIPIGNPEKPPPTTSLA